MLKSPGRIGRIGAALIAKAAAAVGIIYQIRAKFTGEDQALANGNTLTPTGGGGTYEGYVDDGSIKIVNLATGSASITSNKLRMDGPDGGGYHSTFGQSGSFDASTPGTAVKWTFDSDAGGAGMPDMEVFLSDTDADPGNHASFRLSFTTAASNELQSNNYDGNSTQDAVFSGIGGKTPVAGTPYQFAVVLGGYASSGAPDVTGSYGWHSYLYDGANWELLATHKGTQVWGTTYLVCEAVKADDATYGYVEYDDIFIPNSSNTVEGVFTPTGYMLDTFTEASTVALGSHTADTGSSWTVATGSYSVDGTNDNVYPDSPGSAYTESGLSDFFLIAEMTPQSGGGWYVNYRYTDEDNRWIGRIKPTATWQIIEETTGTQTARATGAPTVTAGATHNVSVRCSGTTIEQWFNGGTKLSYTSSSHQTATKVGLGGDTNTGTTHTFDNLYVLPLTSATYDSELDAIDGS